jgi:type VII secretion integral membrane protein EccD
MSQAAAGASGLVHVTVASGSRRVDLVLPGAIPVAELVPELARSVGLLDATTVYGGYRLITQDGRELATDAGLTMQGVEDGGLITVAAGVDDEPPRVYDDVVEAMADVVEHDLTPWQPAAGRRTALWAAGLALALGAYTLRLEGPGTLTAVAATVVAILLVSGAVVLSRAQTEPEAAVAVGWMGAGYAAVAGILFLQPDAPLENQIAAAGAGALVAGLVALLGIDVGRPLLLPVVIVGGLLALGGLLLQATGWDPGHVFVVVLTVVVIAGSVFPWLALGVTSTRVDQIYSVADITTDPAVIDGDRVRSDARLAHEILVAVTATVGVLLALVAPFAVSLGIYGTLLAVVACVVVMLRTRQYRTGSEVRAGLVSGLVGLGSVAVSMLVLQPGWRPTAAVALAAIGAVLLAATLIPTSPSVRRGRLGDVIETICLLSLLPLLILAIGVFSAVRS